MTWQNREGTPAEQRLKDIQEQFGLGNLVNNKIVEEMPTVDSIQEGQLQLVKDGAGFHLVSKQGGIIKKVTFT